MSSSTPDARELAGVAEGVVLLAVGAYDGDGAIYVEKRQIANVM